MQGFGGHNREHISGYDHRFVWILINATDVQVVKFPKKLAATSKRRQMATVLRVEPAVPSHSSNAAEGEIALQRIKTRASTTGYQLWWYVVRELRQRQPPTTCNTATAGHTSTNSTNYHRFSFYRCPVVIDADLKFL